MSELKKITAQQMDEQGVCAAPNILNGTPAENKGIFDRMVRQLVAPAYNEMVEAVDLINSQQEEWSQEEQGRETAEASRSAAETGREAAETERRAAEEIRKQNEAAREAAEKNRKDGTTFVPEVSEDGVLSWSNSDGKQNPESRNIRGPAGPAGMVISREEPTDHSHPAWLDPDGEEVSGLLDPVEKTEGMTQPVGRDGEGKLWTEPTGGGMTQDDLDDTLSEAGKAADAAAVGDALASLSEEIANGGGSGLSATARTLLIAILRNGVYTADQSTNITELEAALKSTGDSGGGSGGESGGAVSASYSNGNLTIGGVVAAYSSSVLSLSNVSATYNNGVLALT